MPTYEYECFKCRKAFEIRQRISEPPLTTCEACGGTVRRLLSAAPFILKGEGWYVTDYPSEARKKARESEKSADSKPAGEKPAGEKSSGEKPAGEKSSGEKSSGEKPAGEKSSGEKSSGEKSSTSSPSPAPPASTSGTTAKTD